MDITSTNITYLVTESTTSPYEYETSQDDKIIALGEDGARPRSLRFQLILMLLDS